MFVFIILVKSWLDDQELDDFFYEYYHGSVVVQEADCNWDRFIWVWVCGNESWNGNAIIHEV